MSRQRIYVVHDGKTERLIRAGSQAQAIKHATKPYTAEVASQDDLLRLLAANVEVEQAEAAEPAAS